MGLGLDDDLVLAIHRRHAGVALDDALARRHLRALVIGAVALAHRARRPARSSGCLASQSRSWAASRLQPREAPLRLGGEVGLDRQRVVSSRCRCSIVVAAASSFAAWRSNSARVPLRCFEALLGSFTPSIANISRPIRPCASQIASTAVKICAMSGPSVLTKCAKVVKCGVRCAAQRHERHVLAAGALDARLLTMPCE